MLIPRVPSPWIPEIVTVLVRPLQVTLVDAVIVFDGALIEIDGGILSTVRVAVEAVE